LSDYGVCEILAADMTAVVMFLFDGRS